LSCSFFALAGGFLKQSFKSGTLHVYVHRRPFFLVDHVDQSTKIHRIGESGHRLREDVAE
jgi:hypothetical protein